MEIQPGSFSGQHALIVGGSRGLGEYTAKAIVAGGGAVTLTYAVGRTEAEAVLSDIESAGGKGGLLAYDVRQHAAPQLKTLQSLPTHVYYFATNSIFRHRGNDFDTAKFMEFYQFYVGGFYDLCKALRETVPGFKVFYPSSIFVTTRQRGVTEYAMAKAAGEIMCADLPRLLPGVTVHMSRLPRLPTDQTATAMQTGMENTADIILPILRAMQE